MDFSVQFEGLDEFTSRLSATPQNITREVDKALYVSAQHVESEAKKSILGGQKSGKLYKRHTVTHQASAPGEAPASDTGRLVASINSYLNTSEHTAFVVAGRGTVKYATMLEFGTSKMAPRPFLFPALERSKTFIQERLSQAFRNAVSSS